MSWEASVARALDDADFGDGTAEDDNLLESTFVTTRLWNDFYGGAFDIVLGAKGSGKSAIYGNILAKADELRRQGIHVVGAQHLTEDPLFNDLPSIGPMEHSQLVRLWKMYVLSLVGDILRRLPRRRRSINHILAVLDQNQLLAPRDEFSLRDSFKRVLAKVNPYVEMNLPIGPEPPSVKFGVAKSDDAQGASAESDPLALYGPLGQILRRRKRRVWVLIDRLDLAFPAAGSELELQALLSLLHTYIDLHLGKSGIELKLFLRDDVWDRIIAKLGETETDSVGRLGISSPQAIRERVLKWEDASLRELLVRRLFHNNGIRSLYGAGFWKARRNPGLLTSLLDVALRWPVEDGVGSVNDMLDSLRDGTGHVSPREIIDLLRFAQQVQIERIGRDTCAYVGRELFEPVTLQEAERLVSDRRLYRTLCREYPHLYRYVSRLQGVPDSSSVERLSHLWDCPVPEARRTVDELVALGFFQAPDRGTNPHYQVAPLYRPALALGR